MFGQIGSAVGLILSLAFAAEAKTTTWSGGAGLCSGREPACLASSVRTALVGRVGEAVERCLESRVCSEWANGPMYEEAVHAFRTHADDKRNGWQNEYWGKTMLCFAGAIGYTGDPALKARTLAKAHSFVDEFQRENGYLSTYAQEDSLGDPTSGPGWCFNVWGRKYTLWALVELHKATGDRKCLESAVRLADHLIGQLRRVGRPVWQTGAWHGVSSMSILKPVLELYEITKKPDYRAFADAIVAALENPELKEGALLANAKKTEPIAKWFPEPGFWAKAYEIMSCLEGAVHYHRITGEKRVLDEVLAFYGHLEREELNAVGSVGHFDHFFGGGQQFNGMTELCDVIHWIRLNRELLQATGEARFADRIEEAFYNAFLAGVTRDGRWGAHIVKSHGSRHLWAPPQTGMFHHQCCPDNMLRGFLDYASVCVRAAKERVEVVMYNDLAAETSAGRVTVRGGYPWSENAVAVTVASETEGTVRFRVPGWARTMRIDGREVASSDGWTEVRHAAGTTTFALSFDMAPRVLAPASVWAPKMPPSPQPGGSRSDVGVYTVRNMEWLCPEMRGRVRAEAAFRVARGPLLLAKARLAGETSERTFAAFSPENGFAGWQMQIEPQKQSVANAGVAAAWNLTLERGVERATFRVTDFASASNVDDPSNWFSLWF